MVHVEPFLMAVGQLTPSLSPSGHLLYSCTFSATRPFIRMLELDEEEEACVRPAGRPALRSFPRLRVRPPPPPTRSLLSLMKSKWQFRSCTMVGRGRSVGRSDGLYRATLLAFATDYYG